MRRTEATYRMQRVKKLVEEGLTTRAMADRLGLTTSAVNQLVKRMGLEVKDRSKSTIGVPV